MKADGTVFFMQAYVRKQAQCLLDIQGGRSDKHHDSLSHLRRWSLEAAALAVCFCSSGHHAVDVLHSLNMQDGTLFRDPLPETAHVELLVSDCRNSMVISACDVYLGLDAKHMEQASENLVHSHLIWLCGGLFLCVFRRRFLRIPSALVTAP